MFSNVLRDAGIANDTSLLPNTAFSERHPEIAQNASFSRKIGTFHPSFVQTASRSLVKNDRPLSLRGASVLGYAPRFLAFSWLLRNPVSRANPPSHPKRVTLAIRLKELEES